MSPTQNYFHLDPLAGEVSYKEEPAYGEFIAKLPYGAELKYIPCRTEFEPRGPLIVGCCYNIKIRLFPDNSVLNPGAVIKFSIPRTWTQPQNSNIEMPGYVTVSGSKGASGKLWFTQNENLQWWICTEITDAADFADGFLEIAYYNVTVQRFPQEQFINYRNCMRVIVQQAGDYAVVPANRTEKPVVIAAPASKINIAAPAAVANSDEVAVKFSLLDYCNNRAQPYLDTDIFAASLDSPFNPLATMRLKHEDKGTGQINVSVPENAKRFRIIVSDRKDTFSGISPNIVVDPDPDRLNVYFGDIHAKSILSDGLKTPEEYYEHARDVALNDFSSIADHNCLEASRIEGPFVTSMSDEAFAVSMAACEKFNEPGRFATIQAFEQNEINGYPGHRNIYFKGKCPGLFRGKTLDELYKYLEGHDALVIPHHTIIWGTRVHLDNDKYSRVLEMYSMHCSSEVKGSPLNNYSTSQAKAETGQSAREILDMGYKVGFIAASDNHNGAPGLSAKPSRFSNLVYNGGLAAVFAPELTREAIFDGLYNRRCYATTGVRIYLDFKTNGNFMGSEFKADIGATLPYKIIVAGTERIASVELICNNNVEKLHTYDGSDYKELNGEIKIAHKTNWIYVRVTQIDRNMAWSSPIYISENQD